MAKQLKKGSKGKAVEQVQQALLKLGYELPKWGADGALGFETIAALKEFAFATGRPLANLPSSEEPIEPALIDELLALAATKKSPKPRGIAFVDATEMHAGKHRKGVRSWQSITGVTLHQTGIYMTNTVKRFLRLRAHIGIIEPKLKGTIVLVNPLTSLMWHANGLNKSTVGIEINGLFEGIDGKGVPRYQKHLKLCRVSERQILAARKCLGWIRDEVARHGGELKYVYAHRQSSGTRRSDPGSRVWQEVALWAEQNLGLSTRPNFTSGKGAKIPKAWDERQTGVKY